jgi:uncharacterized protein YllA (UPF0747 family)
VDRVSFRDTPSPSSLFLDYLENPSSLRQFYPRDYSIDAIAEFAQQRHRPGPESLDQLCSALAVQQKRWGGGNRGVEKLRAGAVAILTGQQPGLFTGPMYTIYKAMSAIKLARALEGRGIAAVPVFWIAAEDHDHEEIRTASILNRDSGLHHMKVDLVGEETAPVGWTEYSGGVTASVAGCLENLPKSEFLPEVQSVLEGAYSAGSSPVDAFGRMIVALFGGTELVAIDPLQPELKSLALPTILEAVRRNVELRAAVLDRSAALSRAGYHEQVRVDRNFTGLFAYRGKSRQALKPEDLPADIPMSPNVLLRPIVQDRMFPTAAYVGGPAEIAYFAQVSAVYETLGCPMPPVVPRISATIVEPRIGRVLQKYALDLRDVFRGREFFQRKAVEGIHDVTEFDRARATIASAMDALGPVLKGVDPTLLGSLETSQQKMVHQLEGLRTKFLNAESRRNEVLERQLDALGNSLFPDKKPQERVINVTSFIGRYGLGLIGRLLEQLSVETNLHQVVEIQ